MPTIIRKRDDTNVVRARAAKIFTRVTGGAHGKGR
jgi:hypothetical protein